VPATEWRKALRVVVETTLCSCALGIAMDLVTANVAVDYFAIHHPHVVDSRSPWVLALVWGVLASWWFGAIAGGLLCAILLVRRTPIPVRRIRSLVVRACGILWLIFMAMLAGWYVVISLLPIPRRSDFDYNRRIMAVALTHMTEYVLGAIVFAVILVTLLRESKRAATAAGPQP